MQTQSMNIHAELCYEVSRMWDIHRQAARNKKGAKYSCSMR